MSEPVIPLRRKRRPDINIVPLVDVLVTLIFFFLMFMQFKDLTTLNLELPEISTPGKNTSQERPINIALTSEGTFLLNHQTVNAEQLSSQLQTLARENPERPVLVSADINSRTGDLTQIMDLCRKFGLINVSLQTK